MTPLVQLALTCAGVFALAASLRNGNASCWLAVVGSLLLLPVVVWDADPVLGLGLLAFLGVRGGLGKAVSEHGEGASATHGSKMPASRSDQAP